MRRILATTGIAIVSALVDYILSALSMLVRALPPAHYAAWMTLLEGTCASRLQLDVVNAAMQWYGGPVVIGLTGFIVGVGARIFGVELGFVVVGVAAFAVIKGVFGGSFDAPSAFSVFFAMVCAGGGCAFASSMILAYQRHLGRREGGADL
jgi:hypothetical protein